MSTSNGSNGTQVSQLFQTAHAEGVLSPAGLQA